eukprot:Nitzschia sp. Nitz4//scaffold208_size52459//6374//7009//NITZ4_006805-RA/size52459-processed-gene-0.20-mRNA-1//1//CDS//3329541636//7355//frame0
MMEAAPAESPDIVRSSKKRSRSDLSSDDEKQRLRDKNRTNSKRFRDRKKNYMDGLFEEKYHLGKANNDLRMDNERLRKLLDEAKEENERHKRNAALGLYDSQVKRSSINPSITKNTLNLGALYPTSQVNSSSLRSAHIDRMIGSLNRPHALDDVLFRPPAITPSLTHLIEVEGAKRQRALGDLALLNLEQSLKAKLATDLSGAAGILSAFP